MELRTKPGALPELVITSVDPPERIDLTKYSTAAQLHELMTARGFAKVTEDGPINMHENCYSWRDSGECVTNPAFMRANCARACRDLRDAHAECAQWSAKGECTTNPKFMNAACPVSCGWKEEL